MQGNAGLEDAPVPHPAPGGGGERWGRAGVRLILHFLGSTSRTRGLAPALGSPCPFPCPRLSCSLLAAPEIAAREAPEHPRSSCRCPSGGLSLLPPLKAAALSLQHPLCTPSGARGLQGIGEKAPKESGGKIRVSGNRAAPSVLQQWGFLGVFGNPGYGESRGVPSRARSWLPVALGVKNRASFQCHAAQLMQHSEAQLMGSS